jgi:uncharacterized protein
MRAKETDFGGRRALVVVCTKGEEAFETVATTVREREIRAAQVTAVGGFANAELGYFDASTQDYLRIPVDEQVEVLSLMGDVAQDSGETALHLHAVLGRRDGSTVGGHLLRGEVWPTLEVIVTEVAPELAKRYDPQTGLALISP